MVVSIQIRENGGVNCTLLGTWLQNRRAMCLIFIGVSHATFIDKGECWLKL